MTYLYAVKDYEIAAHYLWRSLKASDWRDSIVRKAYALLTTSRICQEEWDLAITANEGGRQYYPDDAELLFQAGQIYQQLNRFDEARQALGTAAARRGRPALPQRGFEPQGISRPVTKSRCCTAQNG